MRVLVTGLSGLIGGALRRRLQGAVDLVALNRRDVPGVETIRADITRAEALSGAFAGVDVVVHLAALPGEHFPWEGLRDVNIAGTHHVFQAARAAGVRRIVFASSGATVSGWEHDEPYKALVEGRYADVSAPWPLITVDMPPRPAGIYGSTKVWGEALGRQLADSSGCEVVSLRIGYVNAEDRPVNPRQASVWLSQRDVAEVTARAVLQHLPQAYNVCFATSNNRWGYRDLAHTQALLGWQPQDAA